MTDYEQFLQDKVVISADAGLVIEPGDINPILKDHQKQIVQWMVKGGKRACFAAFGLGKSVIQLEAVRLVRERVGGLALIAMERDMSMPSLFDAIEEEAEAIPT